jgi:hypothetical protein
VLAAALVLLRHLRTLAPDHAAHLGVRRAVGLLATDAMMRGAGMVPLAAQATLDALHRVPEGPPWPWDRPDYDPEEWDHA